MVSNNIPKTKKKPPDPDSREQYLAVRWFARRSAASAIKKLVSIMHGKGKQKSTIREQLEAARMILGWSYGREAAIFETGDLGGDADEEGGSSESEDR